MIGSTVDELLHIVDAHADRMVHALAVQHLPTPRGVRHGAPRQEEEQEAEEEEERKAWEGGEGASARRCPWKLEA